VQLFVAFLFWGCISLAWSPLPERGFLQLAAFGAVFASGLILMIVEPGRHGAIFHKLFALCLAIGGLIVTLDLLNGLPLASLVRKTGEAHRYNMIVVSLLILCWGLSARPDVSRLWLSAAWLSVSIAAFVSDSESAKLALLASGAVWGLSMFASRTTLIFLIGLCILLCWASAPWLGALVDAVVVSNISIPEAAHAQDRLVIWQGGGSAALALMPWGAGAGSALAFAEDRMLMGRFDGLGWGHTHNNFLQVWLELGVPGVLLGCFASLALWQASSSMKPRAFGRCCGLVAATCVISLVSHGLWQAWFWAAVVLSLVALRHTSYCNLEFDFGEAT
jgi:O-antigen ligase